MDKVDPRTRGQADGRVKKTAERAEKISADESADFPGERGKYHLQDLKQNKDGRSGHAESGQEQFHLFPVRDQAITANQCFCPRLAGQHAQHQQTAGNDGQRDGMPSLHRSVLAGGRRVFIRRCRVFFLDHRLQNPIIFDS